MVTDPDFRLKQGDTYPPIEATLTDAAGAALGLTGATVRFRMRPIVPGAAAVDRVATITDTAAGEVRHDWQAADGAVIGDYRAEWHVTFPGGAEATVPNGGHLLVRVVEALG